MTERREGSWFSGFFAILNYEFLWNLRKKKTISLFLIIFAILTLELVLPPILAYTAGQEFQKSSTFVIDSATVLPNIFIFLLGVATTMNTISGEFESGSIVPLLTKPVSKNMVFLGKIVAASLTLLAAYAFLAVYATIGGLVVHGAQENLRLLPLGVVGLTGATMVWASISVLLGTLSKNSLVAALGTFGVFIGLSIIGITLASFLGQTWILFYTPGDGPQGSTGTCQLGGGFGGNNLPTGTNALGALLVQWVLNPDLMLNFCGFTFRVNQPPIPQLLSSDTITTTVLRAVGVTISYTAILLLVSWFAFRRTQVLE